MLNITSFGNATCLVCSPRQGFVMAWFELCQLLDKMLWSRLKVFGDIPSGNKIQQLPFNDGQ